MNDYELVYPFIVCESNGGPYEDQSFVAGVYFGMLMAAFEAKSIASEVAEDIDERVGFTLPSALLPQVDLLAMRWECSVTLERHDDTPEWTTVYFSKSEE